MQRLICGTKKTMCARRFDQSCIRVLAGDKRVPGLLDDLKSGAARHYRQPDTAAGAALAVHVRAVQHVIAMHGPAASQVNTCLYGLLALGRRLLWATSCHADASHRNVLVMPHCCGASEQSLT